MPPAEGVDPLFIDFQHAVRGRYSLDRELGRGGMGVVYLARDVRLDRLVAIKLLPPERAADAMRRERFLQEARLAARLSHPHVIPIHGVHDEGSFVYYVMAFVDGESLAERVRRRGPLAHAEAARVMREVAWALGHAHAHDLVHRDVKPDNVLLESGTGRVLVVDFGIAAAAGSVGGPLSGTPEFMSPEQVLGDPVESRSDLYALGVTMFFALTGHLPFEGSSTTEVLAHHVASPPPSVAAMGTPVPRRLAQVVDACLAKNPGERPPSADALAERLDATVVRRRELPAPLRAFVKGGGRINGVGTILAGFATLVGGSIIGGAFGISAYLAFLASSLLVVPSAFFVQAACRLRVRGFVRADLASAFASELELSREERLIEHERRPRWVEGTLRVIMLVSWLLFGTLVLVQGLRLGADDGLMMRTALSFLAGITATMGYLAVVGKREDVDTLFWSAVWTGPIGRAAFGLATRLVAPPEGARSMTHRATELALGLAAEQLFEQLPRPLRQSLGDLPSLLARLQDDARRLRARGDQLRDEPHEMQELGAERELVTARLAETVGAMETIRLELLRLHVGRGCVEGLTTHLGMAAEVSDQVRRLVAAREEIESGLAAGGAAA